MFSVSNGYLGNLCMMLGPKTSESTQEQERIASLMVAVLVMGIGIGSALSYPVVNLLWIVILNTVTIIARMVVW